MPDIGIEQRRLAIEIIATLVHIKSTMAAEILKPAGVPIGLYGPLLRKRDEITGRPLTKRQMAHLILDALEKRPDGPEIIRRIIEIAAGWTKFHLADDEFAARATVQKAQEVLGELERFGARASETSTLTRGAQLGGHEIERAAWARRESDLLLRTYDELAQHPDPWERGYVLQGLLQRLFDLHEIPVFRSFSRNEGGEQIDGAFKLEGWLYLVECRWREKLADIRELDGLKGQVSRSGKQTMGLFVSINGWSRNVIPLLRQNPDKSIILMDGYDLRMVLAGEVGLRELLEAKIVALNLKAEPYLGVAEHLKERYSSTVQR